MLAVKSIYARGDKRIYILSCVCMYVHVMLTASGQNGNRDFKL